MILPDGGLTARFVVPLLKKGNMRKAVSESGEENNPYGRYIEFFNSFAVCWDVRFWNF